METWTVEKAVGNRDLRKYVENGAKYDRMCEKCCFAERENIVDFVQGIAQGCTLSPNIFKMYILTT